MENSYAQALWNMVAEGMDAKKAVHALRDKLMAEGRVALFPRVARAFERIAQRELNRSDVTLTIAHEKDSHKAKSHIKEVLASMGAGTKNLKTQVDDTLIGGWRLEGMENLFDASYKSQLLDLYNRATRS